MAAVPGFKESVDLAKEVIHGPKKGRKKTASEPTREEWYRSTKFKLLRMLNNLSHEIVHKAQSIGDVMDICSEIMPDIIFFDKFTIFDRQLRVTRLEVDKLIAALTDLDRLVSPKKFKDSL